MKANIITNKPEEEKVLNILSIDMDYILSPCINLYNDLVSANVSPEELWDSIEKLRNIDSHISYDDMNLRYVFNIFTLALSRLKDKSNVSFALNHDAILYDLGSSKYLNNKFNIYNIDHHHDVFYGDSSRTKVDNYDSVDVGNWVWYLDKYQKINKYNWICNQNSIPLEKAEEFKVMKFGTASKFMDIFSIKEWDYIFICNSPHWFPRKYDIFFAIMRDIYKNITGLEPNLHENVFSPAGLSRPYPYDKKNKD